MGIERDTWYGVWGASSWAMLQEQQGSCHEVLEPQEKDLDHSGAPGESSEGFETGMVWKSVCLLKRCVAEEEAGPGPQSSSKGTDL